MPLAFFHPEGPSGDQHWIDLFVPFPALFVTANSALTSMCGFSLVGVLYVLGTACRNKEITKAENKGVVSPCQGKQGSQEPFL